MVSVSRFEAVVTGRVILYRSGQFVAGQHRERIGLHVVELISGMLLFLCVFPCLPVFPLISDILLHLLYRAASIVPWQFSLIYQPRPLFVSLPPVNIYPV